MAVVVVVVVAVVVAALWAVVVASYKYVYLPFLPLFSDTSLRTRTFIRNVRGGGHNPTLWATLSEVWPRSVLCAARGEPFELFWPWADLGQISVFPQHPALCAYKGYTFFMVYPFRAYLVFGNQYLQLVINIPASMATSQCLCYQHKMKTQRAQHIKHNPFTNHTTSTTHETQPIRNPPPPPYISVSAPNQKCELSHNPARPSRVGFLKLTCVPARNGRVVNGQMTQATKKKCTPPAPPMCSLHTTIPAPSRKGRVVNCQTTKASNQACKLHPMLLALRRVDDFPGNRTGGFFLQERVVPRSQSCGASRVSYPPSPLACLVGKNPTCSVPA